MPDLIGHLFPRLEEASVGLRHRAARLRTLPQSPASFAEANNLYLAGPSLFPWPRGATPTDYLLQDGRSHKM